MNRRKGVLFIVSFSFAIISAAGTITFKDGSTISDAEIISINDGGIVIEKDKARKRFSLSQITSYYQTDISSASLPGGGADSGKFAEYKVSILNIDMPNSGKTKDGKTQVCDVSYTLNGSSSGDSKVPRKMKVPYFYLYVLTSSGDDDAERKVHRFCSPDSAKPKGNNYDLAAVMEKVSGFDRQVWNDEEVEMPKEKIGGRKLDFELKGIGDRRILAYHMEVWGNNGKIAQKNGTVQQSRMKVVKVGENWWERL